MWVIVLSDGDGCTRTEECRGPWDTEKAAQDKLVELARSLGVKWVTAKVLEVKEL